ncbi:MAG: response regulator transcription factor, partial [Candidatus Eremiobacterota bacterium]
MSEGIRVLLIEDHELVRGAFQAILDKESDIQVMGSVESAEEALGLLSGQEPPHVITLDLVLGRGMSGHEAALRILAERPGVRILVVSQRMDAGELSTLLRAGVHGFLSKRTAVGEFVRAVRTVASGQLYFCPESTVALAQVVARPADSELLTTRETEILLRTTRGMTTAEIAKDLCLSPKTVEKHR